MNTTRQMDNIKVLRVLACLGVFAVHCGQSANFQGIIRTLTDFGTYCPILFFMLSGLVAFLSMEKPESLATYYKKRALRLLPVYYLVILTYFILYQFVLQDVPADNTGLYWVRYLFLFSGLIPSEDVFWTNLGATWTIHCFVLFYLLAPFLHRLVKTLKQALLLWGITLFTALTLVHFCNINPINGFVNLQYFVMGIVVYFIYKEKENWQAVTLPAFALLLLTIYREHVSPDLLFSLLFMLLLIGSKTFTIKQKPLKTVVTFLDKHSYTIYLVHPIMVLAANQLDFRSRISNQYLWRLACLGLIFTGTLLFTLVIDGILQKITALKKAK